jgi:aryl-alcohol dehydrogenase-like predicted oxidoreductase
MARTTRRDFLKATLATAAVASTGGAASVWAEKRSATDWVTLGNSGVKVTRLAFGTGAFSGRENRDLGQEDFTRLVRHAYDQGIRFFDTAEGYRDMHNMLSIALKGIPRDTYQLMTKYSIRGEEDPQAKIDRFRKELNSEYFDILLIHCVRSPNWPDETKRVQDAFSEAKSRKAILAHGASVHGLQPLAKFPGNKWLDVALMRVNHVGIRMDTADLKEDTSKIGDVNQVVAESRKIHAQGTGVLAMKLVGEGQLKTREQRQASLKFVMGLGSVDAVTIGYMHPSHVDEAIANMNAALNA